MAELILQLQDTNGDFICEKYINIPSPRSAYIAISFTDSRVSENLANSLKDTLIRTLLTLGSNIQKVLPPCEGASKTFGECFAINNSSNSKLLIVVGDGNTDTLRNDRLLQWGEMILPVLKRGSSFKLPVPFKLSHVAFWENDIDEIIPVIFSKLGISDEDSRIFISYRRTDTEELAEQLFDALNHNGFEVFLDRFSIEPGINFQDRLYQELADKAMVVCLESPNYLLSQWVQFEIAFARQYRLGIYALNIGGAPRTRSIDDEYRELVDHSSFVTNSGRLLQNELDSIISKIKERHSLALYWKKYYMMENVYASLKAKGQAPIIDANGFIHVITNREYKIWATPRPPRINDYHYTDILNSKENRIIYGPKFIERKREVLNTWLSQKAIVNFYNEGQIMEMVGSIINTPKV